MNSNSKLAKNIRTSSFGVKSSDKNIDLQTPQ